MDKSRASLLDKFREMEDLQAELLSDLRDHDTDKLHGRQISFSKLILSWGTKNARTLTSYRSAERRSRLSKCGTEKLECQRKSLMGALVRWVDY